MVTKPALLDALTEGVRLEASDLLEFFPAPDGSVGVNTSLLYPDRDEVQVWVTEQDGGDAWLWLRKARCFQELGERQMALIGEVRRSLVLEGEGVELVARVTDVDDVGTAILDVALGAVRVADISYTCQNGGGA